MPALLFTECLQVDFVKPLTVHEALPNALHVGHSEARRLMGQDPQTSPVRRFLSWAHQRAGHDLSVVHIRDWHDREDPRQRSHLDLFGEHCIQHTPGAEFVFELPDESPAVQIVDATTLNDFTDTNLPQLISPHAATPCRVGITGVWTEAKVSFLAYELRTRFPNFELGVCSALCASSSRSEHYHALEQLVRVLGVEVFESVGQFSDWLAGQRVEVPLPGVSDSRPLLQVHGEAAIAEADRRLIRYLFRDCSSVALKVLDGGFSGNLVLGATGTDRDGHEQVAHVVKIGPRGPIAQERAHFQRIEAVLGNSAPQITEFADFEERGALKYRYASMGGGFSSTFQRQFAQGLAQERVQQILDTVFLEQLGRLYAAARLERCNLLKLYGFSPQWASGVRERVAEVIRGPADGERIEIPLSDGESVSVPNVVRFYSETLSKLPQDERDRTHLAYVHGDLNGANIVIDQQSNVWLIDFFHTRRSHVLMDLIKLENDLLYIMTALHSTADLKQAFAVTDWLLEVRDLRAELQLPSFVTSENLQRTLAAVKQLRSYYPQLVGSDRSVMQLLTGQLRYAVHTLSFDESTPLQKRWALYTACRAAELLTQMRQIAELRIDWLPDAPGMKGRIGLTLLPGRIDLGRDLSDDLSVLRRENVTRVICLLGDDELTHYGVAQLMEEYAALGIAADQLPIVDQKVCSVEEMQRLSQLMEDEISTGGKVLVHCAGGLGRSGMVVACFLKQVLAMSPEDAIEMVRAARSPRAVETQQQVDFVKNYT